MAVLSLANLPGEAKLVIGARSLSALGHGGAEPGEFLGLVDNC